MKRAWMIGVAVVALALTGCGDDDGDDDGGGDTTVAQIANPASVYCEEQGGTVEMVEEAGGTVGYCNLPDGTRIEEWEYYRQANPDATDPGG
jgi:putative hemolysin